MVRTQLMLSQEHYHFLRKLSGDSGRSMSELVREAIDKLRVERAAKREQLLSIVGKFRDDRGDVAERHDDYFADAVKGDK